MRWLHFLAGFRIALTTNSAILSFALVQIVKRLLILIDATSRTSSVWQCLVDVLRRVVNDDAVNSKFGKEAWKLI